MQNYQDLTDTTPIENSNVVTGVISAGNAPELEKRLTAFLGPLVLANPNAGLVDFGFTGGGAGGILTVLVVVTPNVGATNYPLLAQTTLAIREAADDLTLNVALSAFRATLPADAALVAYDVATMGAGAVFCALQAWLVPQG